MKRLPQCPADHALAPSTNRNPQMRQMKTKFQRYTTPGLIVILTMLPGLIPMTQAESWAWDGGGPNSSWTTPANWAGNVAPNPGDDLSFPSAQPRPNCNNNYTAGTTFNSLAFPGGGPGSAYDIGGASIALNAGIHVENNNGVPLDHTVHILLQLEPLFAEGPQLFQHILRQSFLALHTTHPR